MQNLGTSQVTGLSLELFHIQTNTSFALPTNQAVTRLGKPHEQINPDIDVSDLPDADIVSRRHAEILIEKGIYYLVDVGSSNGTFLNNVRLEPKQRYPLNVGDRIDLGQESKVSFLVQSQLQTQHPGSHPTVFQPQTLAAKKQSQVDRPSKIIGSALIIAGTVVLAANTQIGVVIRIPSVALLIIGVILLLQQSSYRVLGWVLIGLGVAVLLFTGNVFATVNFLAILTASVLLFAGYQLFTTGKIYKYSLDSLKNLIKKR